VIVSNAILPNSAHRETLREIANRETREMWREVARLITSFDVCSPKDFLADEIGEFFRKKRARPAFALRASARQQHSRATVNTLVARPAGLEPATPGLEG
jgi:hypothetical protein